MIGVTDASMACMQNGKQKKDQGLGLFFSRTEKVGLGVYRVFLSLFLRGGGG